MKRAQILVVDPDPVTLTALAAILHCHDYDVHCAQDRAAAIRGTETLDLDLIVCDEDIDGPHAAVSVLDVLREIPDKADVPVMFLTSRQRPDIIHRPYGSGIAYHLRKPIEPKMFLDLVEKALWQLPLINHRVRQPHISLPLSATTGASPIA